MLIPTLWVLDLPQRLTKDLFMVEQFFPFGNKREKGGSIENFFSVLKVLKSRGYLGRGSSLLISRY